MNGSSVGSHIERLQGLFLDSFDKQSLRELLLFRMDQTLAHQVAEGDNFRTVVFNLLVKALMEGWLVKLAQEARDKRTLKPDWVVAVQELEVSLSWVEGSVPVPRSKAPSEDLKAVIQRYDKLVSSDRFDGKSTAMQDDLVSRIATFPLHQYSLIDFFLLSDSPGYRLAAVLSLTRSPRAECLHWLSERIGVESPAIGLYASEALLEASKTLPLPDLDSVVQAAESAIKWLSLSIPSNSQPDGLGRSLDFAIKTLDTLSKTIDRVNRRTTI